MTRIGGNPRRLQSYLCGAWEQGEGEGHPIAHAATGAAYALIGSQGLDYKGALEWGRKVGGDALRKYTIHERALMLKAIGVKLLERKEELYQESFATGVTRRDAWPDIDGGIGTLLSFSSRARRDFPNTSVLTEGPVEQLSRDGSFVAQHILSPLEGVAIHINAFNFPIWGMLEKIAPALIAGVPCLVKPASQTAYLTELVTRRILEMDILPKGALQLICGSPTNLLDHVGEQDIVTFTGAASTGHAIRTLPAIVEKSVRFSMEADSLNATILGKDVTKDSPEFSLFVNEIVREICTKSGQKCTAIRRILVPRNLEYPIIEALSQKLSKIAVGLPQDDTTRMGSLVSLKERDAVRRQVQKIQVDADIVNGSIEDVKLISGDAEYGAFLNPVLLHCKDAMRANAVHEVEAFGPVATVMAYDETEESVAITRKGKGSLVSSVFTNCPTIAGELTRGLASYHGRVLLGNRTSAKSSTGHGAALAQLVHGGPGRAGGGEEMGGIRAVKHFMQRSAIQGAPQMLSAIIGEWVNGAPVSNGIHPFRKPLSDLTVGDQIRTQSREVTREDVERFARFTGDTFYAHMNSAAAKENPFFEERVAHGYLIVSFAAGLFVDPDPGPVLANYGVDNLRFLTPVYFGDSLAVQLTCKQINPRENADYGEVRWDCRVTKQNGEVAAQYDVLTMVAKTWPIPETVCQH
ncbi:phenylacetic acid degradation bifunctional protein PaaZ [Flexibacterium corallicola]|uniref:phenylacetic acid degradation bifunctional protein PaaZ n=1 Tax=Flexibacterium corallicola TaxID=3037259 RepID=UPI00286EC34E|nr:phenylacetic acid degradation bifunctional protein PaaZ [Pseudovibrio sp. M1P-2-3]